MAREIKFRAWDKGKKEFVYTDPYDGYVIFNNKMCSNDYGDLCGNDNFEAPEQFWKQDKNGKDVYVGDLVMFNYWSKPLEVKQDENCIYVDFDGGQNMPFSQYFELVGNIHEVTK